MFYIELSQYLPIPYDLKCIEMNAVVEENV